MGNVGGGMGGGGNNSMGGNGGMGNQGGNNQNNNNNNNNMDPQAQLDRLQSQDGRISANSSISGNNQGGMIPGGNNGPSGGGGGDNKAPKTDEERAAWLRHLKEDIAQRAREAAELEASLDMNKRKNDGGVGDLSSSNKRSRKDEEENRTTPV